MMGCEECGNTEATEWAYDMALCSDCVEMLAALDKATS